MNYLLDHYAKTAKRYLRALARIGGSKDFFPKYHELYERGQFDLQNRKHFLEDWFASTVGYFPDIDNPRTLNEKIQWYKLYYDDPLIARCIDKISFKDYIKEVVGSQYVIPLLGVYSSADEINFEDLPNRFVIKANYGSDAKEIIRVTDKSALDIEATRKKVASWAKPWWRDAWGGYEFVQPKILIEEYIENLDGQVYDYKIMCFNGNPDYIIFSTGRFTNQTLDFFDPDWNKLKITSRSYPNSKMKIERPKHLSEMVEISRKVSKQFPLARVDFFEPGDRLYVGELTFYPGGGLGRSSSIKRDYEQGAKLKLPERSK